MLEVSHTQQVLLNEQIFIVNIHHLVCVHGYSVLYVGGRMSAELLQLSVMVTCCKCNKCSVLVGVCVSETQC